MYIQADTHCHSIASTHAYSTVNELAAAAHDAGLKLFCMTDHSPFGEDGPHIWHFHNYKVIPRVISGVTVVKGVEANIVDAQGNIDLPPSELEFMEWVVASLHRFPAGAKLAVDPKLRADSTSAYLGLAKNNPAVDVIGHCTTDGFPFDYERVIPCFKEYGKFVELNESSLLYKSGARKNAYTVFALCKKYEVPIVVSTDCHHSSMIGRTPTAFALLEELDFPQSLIFNSDAERVKEYLSMKRQITFE